MKTCAKCGKEHRGHTVCSACADSVGMCTSCKTKPQDLPGFKKCSRCRNYQTNWRLKQFARVGVRGGIPEWKVVQLEQDRKSAAEVLAMYEKEAIHG